MTDAMTAEQDWDWARVARLVRARLREKSATQQWLANKAGLSHRTVQTLLSARYRPKKWPTNAARIEPALDWEPDTCWRIAHGDHPPSTDVYLPSFLDDSERHIMHTPGIRECEAKFLVAMLRQLRALDQEADRPGHRR